MLCDIIPIVTTLLIKCIKTDKNKKNKKNSQKMIYFFVYYVYHLTVAHNFYPLISRHPANMLILYLLVALIVLMLEIKCYKMSSGFDKDDEDDEDDEDVVIQDDEDVVIQDDEYVVIQCEKDVVIQDDEYLVIQDDEYLVIQDDKYVVIQYEKDVVIKVPDGLSLKDFIDANVYGVHGLVQDRLNANTFYTICITKEIKVELRGQTPHTWTFTYSNDRFDENSPQHKLEQYTLKIERASRPPEYTSMYEQYESCRLPGDNYPDNDITALRSQLHIGTYIYVNLVNAKTRKNIPLSVLGLFNFRDIGGRDNAYHEYVECNDYEMSSDWLFSGGCKSDQYIHVNEMKNHDSIGENKILTTFYLAIQRLSANGTIVPITILEFLVLFNENVSFSILHNRNPNHDMYYQYQR